MSQDKDQLAFSVSELTISILDGFLAAAELHLGVENANGVVVSQPYPMQAWLALKSAGALMDQLSTVMSEDVRVPFNARLTFLFETFEELLPDAPAKPRMAPVASLKHVVEEALGSLEAPAAPAVTTPEAPKGPLIPGTGLPKRGSGLLFPPRGR